MHKNANKTGGLLRQEAAGSYILDRMVQRGLEISLSEGNSGLPLGDGLVADRERVGKLPLGEAAFLPPCGDEAAYFELVHGVRLLSSGPSIAQCGLQSTPTGRRMEVCGG